MKLRILNASLLIALLGSLFINPSLPVHADSICDNPNVSDEIKSASGCDTNAGDFTNSIMGIINAVLSVIAIVAIIVIIISGVQYMTSTGDPSKVKKAKDTILYAVIGLIIVILAAVIVNFVISLTSTSSTTTP